MRYTFLLIFFLIISGNIYSLPFISRIVNYSTADYKASNSNWAVAQDKLGRMYIGNSQGLLEFDGEHWELYPLPNNTIVRSIYISADNRIYVGSYEEFGYFSRNPENRLVYTSLKEKLSGYNFHNDEVWNIVEYNNIIFFQTFSSFFQYNGKSVKGTEARPLNFLPCHGKIYTQTISSGFKVFDGTNFTELIAREKYNNDEILSILPWKGRYILASRNNGLFVYSPSDANITPIKTPIDNELQSYSINKALMTKDSCYILGTVSNGLYALDKSLNVLWKINSENGLRNNTIQNLFCDAENNIWVAMENGIARILHSSPLQLFTPRGHNFGTPYDVLIKQDKVYIASVQGLFLYDAHTNKLELIRGTEGQAWSIKDIDGQLICGHNFGTFRIENGKAFRMPSVIESISIQKCIIHNQEILLQNTYSDLIIYKKNQQQEWTFSNRISDFRYLTTHLEVDHLGNIWAQHMHRGVYRFKLDESLVKIVEMKYYNHLNKKINIKVNVLNVLGRIVFSGDNDFYTYDDLTDSIIPYKQLNEDVPELKDSYQVVRINNDAYWFINNDDYNLVKYTNGHFRIEQRVALSFFDNPPMDNMGNIAFDEEKNAYLYLDGALAKYDPTRIYPSDIPEKLIIKDIAIYNQKENKHIYRPIDSNNPIENSYNNIIISLSYPIKGTRPFTIRYRLEGLDANDQWNTNISSLRKEYSRLPSGKYSFKAEAFDGSRVISGISYDFEIMRPFYLSNLAIAVYIIVALLLITFAFSIFYSKVNKKKNKLIEEHKLKHATEIEKQQKQIIELEKEQLTSELKFKSKELASFTMLNIKNKEFLIHIKEELQKQKIKGQTPKTFLDNLIRVIDENITSEDDWILFQSNFDRIHDNFFRNLKAQYPSLTPNDLRLCALLRLNLSTKDICNMMNISVRGIEGARLRLRKKLNILPEKSLVEFMIEFK